MKAKFLIIVALVALVSTSCGNFKETKEKAMKVMETLQSDENPSQKEYTEALSILNDNYAQTNKLVDEAMKAVQAGDNEKAQDLLNQIKADEAVAQCQQLESKLKTADLDDANRAALEEYEKNAAALSDKIVEVKTAMLDI